MHRKSARRRRLMAHAGNILVEPITMSVEQQRMEAIEESAEQLNEHFSWCELPYDIHQNRLYIMEALEQFDNRRGLYLAVMHRKTKLFLGEMAADWVATDEQRVNIVYWIRKQQQNNGYASKALPLLLTVLRAHFPLLKFATINVEATNMVSMGIAEKAGARLVSYVKNTMNAKGALVNVLSFQVDFDKYDKARRKKRA